MTKFIPIYSLVLLLFMFSCSDEVKNTTKIKSSIPTNGPVKEVKKEEFQAAHEKMPVEILQKIFNECNSIDVTIYNSDKTLNLWDDNVKHVLTMITDKTPSVIDNNIVGHIMMLADGNQLAFVEISLKGDNNYLVYNIDDKKYYNNLTAKGVEFFNKF